MEAQAIVDGLRRGEPRALDAAWAAHQAGIYAFLLRLCGSRSQAEDLAQEVWIRLARHGRRLAPDTRLRPWLLTVARNLHLSERRRAALDLDRLRRRWLDGEDRPPTPFELTAATEAERRLERALATLGAADREVLLLIGVEQLEPQEAAEVLELKPEVLRKRLSRARARLRAILEEP